MNRQELLEDYMTERISQIIQEKDPDKQHEYYKEQEEILQKLDTEHSGKFEDLIDSLIAWSAEECKAVYQAAFLDGLWMGHKAF